MLCCVLVLFVFALCLVYPMLPISLDCTILIDPLSISSVFYESLQDFKVHMMEMVTASPLSIKHKVEISSYFQ